MRTAVASVVAFVLVQSLCGQEPPPPPTERLIRFDPTRVEIAWGREGWSLRVGEMLLKDFGRRQSEATEALRLIRELGLTERGTIGGPTPVLEYWLTRGEGPCGMVRGQRVITFDSTSLRVESEGGQHCLRDARSVLFNFGYAREDAEQALAMVRKYRFTRLVVLGQATPTMMVFLRDPAESMTLSSPQMPPHRMQISPTFTHSLKAVVAEEKKAGASAELAAIRQYATPSIPALGGKSSTPLNMPEGAPTLHAAASPRPTIPGVNDRILHVPFDWRQVQLRRDPDGWLLHAGSLILARFGTEEVPARKALHAMQHYRFTEWCLVGPTNPSAHFYLVNGRAPHGELFGVPSTPLTAEKLSVQQRNGRYVLAQGTEEVLRLGDRPEEARQLLDWIQQAGVDRFCKLTTPDGAGMTFFVRR